MLANRLPARLLAVVLAALPLAAGSCALAFTHGPPQGHEQMADFTCTESDVAPVLDLAWGGYLIADVLYLAANPDRYQGTGGFFALSVAWIGASGISAAVGFDRRRKCIAAKRNLVQRQAQSADAGPLLGSPGIRVVNVTPSTDTLEPEQGVQLVASAFASSGAVVPDRTFTWSSSNDAIASVGNAGFVTAHAPGTVVIAANTDNVVGTASIVVLSPR